MPPMRKDHVEDLELCKRTGFLRHSEVLSTTAVRLGLSGVAVVGGGSPAGWAGGGRGGGSRGRHTSEPLLPAVTSAAEAVSAAACWPADAGSPGHVRTFRGP